MKSLLFSPWSIHFYLISAHLEEKNKNIVKLKEAVNPNI